VIAILTAEASYAAPSLDNSGGTVDEMMDRFEEKSSDISNRFYDAALWLFWALAVIQFTWAAAQLGLKGELSLTSFSQTLIRELMFIGLFYWLLTNYSQLGDWIVGSLRQLGEEATSFGEVTPSNIFSHGINIAHIAISKAYDASVFKAVAAAFPVVVILVAYALAAAACAVYLIEFYILVPCGVILLGFGGSLWTKNYAENYIRCLVSVGMKLLIIQIIIGVTSSFMLDFIAELESSGFEFGRIFTLAGIAIITLMLMQKIPDFASALITGSSFGRAGDLTGAAGAVAGAAAGAAMAVGGKAAQGALAYSDAMNVPNSGGGDSLASISDAANGGGGSSSGGDSVGSALREGKDSGGPAPYATQGEFLSGGSSDSGGSSPSSPGEVDSAASAAGASGDSGSGSASSAGVPGGDGGSPSPSSPGEVDSAANTAGASGNSGSGSADASSASGDDPSASTAQQAEQSASDTGSTNQTAQQGQSQGGAKIPYQGMSKAEYRAKQAWAIKSAIRAMLGFGPTGSYTPGGGGAFRGQELGYPPIGQNAYNNMNPMTQNMINTLTGGQQRQRL
jgi:P-type conjugative transfer protein TrbL